MKKLLVVFLSAVLVLSLSVTVWATTGYSYGASKDSTTTIPVQGTYQSSTGESTPVYSVDISWGSMEFIYKESSKGTWDPATHTYKNSSGSWTCADGADTITVTNHSNAYVSCSIQYTPNDSYSGISGTVTPNSLSFESAEGRETTYSALTNTATLTLNGSLPENATNQVIGQITVTVSG